MRGAHSAVCATYDGEHFRRRSRCTACRPPYAGVPARGHSILSPAADRVAHRCAGERFVHIADIVATEPIARTTRDRSALVDLGGARTLLAVALRKDEHAARRIHDLPPGGPAVLRQADRAVAELRRPGGHRDGERAADQRVTQRTGDLRNRSNSRPRPARCCRSSTRSPVDLAAGVRRDARNGRCGSAMPISARSVDL